MNETGELQRLTDEESAQIERRARIIVWYNRIWRDSNYPVVHRYIRIVREWIGV